VKLAIDCDDNKKDKKMLDNAGSAILVVEFQKTWTERSIFHKLIKKEYESRKVYQNTKQLLESAINNDKMIIQSPFILNKNCKKRLIIKLNILQVCNL
jgi:arsenate reductase-like glutaredoxin family protein